MHNLHFRGYQPMRLLYSVLALSLVFLPIHTLAITDEDVAEVTERLESLSTDQLVERKEELEFLEEKLKSLKRKDLETRYDQEVNLKITKELLKVDERINTLKSLIRSYTEDMNTL